MSGFELWLDNYAWLHLYKLARSDGVSTAEIVYKLICQAYEEVFREQRLQAAENLNGMKIEAPPDPAC